MDVIVIGAGVSGLAAARELRGGHFAAGLAPFDEVWNAARLDRASVKAIAQQTRAAERIGGDRIARLSRGYDAVPRRLARGTRVHFGAQVREVRWTRAGVTVLGRDALYEARRAVVTLPLGVLQDGAVRFGPPLPRWKEDAFVSRTGRAGAAQARAGVRLAEGRALPRRL